MSAIWQRTAAIDRYHLYRGGTLAEYVAIEARNLAR